MMSANLFYSLGRALVVAGDARAVPGPRCWACDRLRQELLWRPAPPARLLRKRSVRPLVVRQALDARSIIALSAGAGALVQRVAGYGGGIITLGTSAVLGGAQEGIEPSLLQEVITILWIPLNFAVLYPNWRAGNIEYQSCLTFLVAAVGAVPIGIAIVSSWNASLVFHTLGYMLAAYGAWQFFTPDEPQKQKTQPSLAIDVIVGAACGILAGAFATPGPAVAIGATACSWSRHDPQTLRGNLAFILGLVTLAVFIVDKSQGLVSDPEVWFTVAACMPAGVLGLALGEVISDSIPAPMFKKLLQGILVLYGALLIQKM
eukprot:TRINITY_DN2412_c0_g2_i1.p1 TRINITY_DN2412_c0_g2~~TRINITY_DN2412_c0_g2_i1.p1  ORF type:complete len:318 (+),score=45.33 TRINITY_DN2412_c0_g2_i1:132-1085(+)